MKFFFYSLLIICSFVSVILIIPEWNISTAGNDLLGSSTEQEIVVNYRDLFGVELKMIKKFNKDSTGKITYDNYVEVSGTKKKVDFEHVESFYNKLNMYIICPRGSYHPYNFNAERYLIPDGFQGENWNLTCFLHEVDNHYFLLVFYHMNGNNVNAYLTNTNYGIAWSNAPTIAYEKKYELYDYRFNVQSEPDNLYKMMAFLKDGNFLRLGALQIYLKNDVIQKCDVNSLSTKHEFELKTYSEGFFRNNTDLFYFMTYNNISDFTTAFTTDAADDYTQIDTMKMSTNSLPDFEFLDDDVEIEKMRFMLNSKFLYYIFKEKNSEKRYYGIFDIQINKIIFNTAEEIITFFPLTLHSMLAITKDKAYEICTYKDSSGKCVDTCSSKHSLDISGNICDSTCNKYKLKPNDICIDSCNETIFYKNDNNECGLCKDFDSNKIYKFEEGNACLSSIPEGAIISNERFHLLKCGAGYQYKDNSCSKSCYDLCASCSEYSDKEEDQKCTSCIEGFFRDDNNNCHCPGGKQKHETKCEDCTNSIECKTYERNTCNCKSCLDKNYLKDNKCEQCSTQCENCITTADTCTSCKDTQFLDNSRCYNCSDSSFCDIKASDSCKCEKCKVGYYLDFYICYQCQTGCKSCTSKDVCNDCESGYYKQDNKCYKCPDNCKETKENSCECKSCYDGQFLDNGECIECSTTETCKNFEEGSCKCTECNDGYYVNKFKCEKCNDNCLACDGPKENDNNHCTKCAETKFLDEGTCVDCSTTDTCKNFEEGSCKCSQCNDGYYVNKFKCEKCSENCIACDGPQESDNHHCTKCAETKFLDEGTCVDCSANETCKNFEEGSCKCSQCNDGYYVNRFKCEKCNDNCLACDGPKENDNNHCTKCVENKFVYEGTCIECSPTETCKKLEEGSCKCTECKEHYFNNKYKCEQCSENCLTCDGAKESDDNNHCTACKESMYLVNIESKNLCVENCTQYNANYTNNEEKKICEIRNDKKNNVNNNNVDYMLWIFVGIIGILLIIISICICKKCCSNKSDSDLLNEANELDEKVLVN